MNRFAAVTLVQANDPAPEWVLERDVALRDLHDVAQFDLPGRTTPNDCALALSERDGRLVFEISANDGAALASFHLSFRPFDEAMRDYAQICEAYFAAVKTMPPAQIEAIDMARRGIHNEGARILTERLEGKITLDLATARRLFTLIFVLKQGHGT